MSSNSLRRVFWKWYCERVQALERSVRLLTDFNELTKSAKVLLTVGKAKSGHVGDRAPHGATWTGDGLASPRELGYSQTSPWLERERLHHPSVPEDPSFFDLEPSTDIQ